jgi:hypothetical protein
MWKRHFIYEYHPPSFIITLGSHLYKIPKVFMTTYISLISEKQHPKVISHATIFSLFTIRSEGGQKVIVTTKASPQDLSIQ